MLFKSVFMRYLLPLLIVPMAVSGHMHAQFVSYVPQVVTGFNEPQEPQRFFRTSFSFVNLSSTDAVNVLIELFDNDGNDLHALRPMAGPGGGSTPSVAFPLPPRAVQSVETISTAFSSPQVGWARVTSSGEIGVAATLQYRDALSGGVVTSTSVLPDPPSDRFSTFVVNSRSGGPRLGIALLNPSDTETAQVRVSLYDDQGAFLGVRTITLRPSRKIAQFFDEGDLFADLDPFFGTAEISSNVNLAATVIRVDGVYWSAFRILSPFFQ